MEPQDLSASSLSTCTHVTPSNPISLTVFMKLVHIIVNKRCVCSIHVLILYLITKNSKFCCDSIQINQPTRCDSFTSLLLDIYVWLNMFWASPHPSLGAYNCTRSLWFYNWKEAAAALLVVVWPARPQPTTLQPSRSNGKTRGS